MKQISIFHKGVTADIDYSKLDNNNLVFPTADIRLTNRDGKGLIITPIKGNEKVFELSPDYVIFGAAQYNGIAYILSYNPFLQIGEIGSFPSPKQGGGFEEVYKPLMNLYPDSPEYYEGGMLAPLPMPMRSTVFDFDLEHPVGDQMVALPDYDGTVSLIFTDNKNVIRLVNSGFNQEGEYKWNRFYWQDTLKESIELIKAIPEDQRVQFVDVLPNGNLPHGNYFFFYRYLDQSNNPTVFVGESQPISVYEFANTDPNIKKGGVENSGKAIALKLSNLDTSFSFVEFAYIRFFSGVDGITLSEVQRVGKLFSIPPNGEIEATITGFETIVPFTIGAILEPVNNDVICESIVNYDRRMWGGNWRAKPIEIEILRQAALQIKLGCDDSKTIPRQNFQNFYAQPENIRFAGYFRGEAYLCRVAFKLKNGYETEAFPVKGIDARGLAPSEIPENYGTARENNRGIIIMPQQPQSPIVKDYIAPVGAVQLAHIMALTFDISGLKQWMNNQPWFKENVSEIIFLRAERKPNLAYQGVATRVFGRKIKRGLTNFDHNNASIPIMINKDASTNTYRNAFPSVARSMLGGSTGEAPRKVVFTSPFLSYTQQSMFYADNQSEEEQRIRAVFSTDYIFGDKNKISDSSRPWIVPNFKIQELHDVYEGMTNGIRHYIPSVNIRSFYNGLRVLPTTFNYRVEATGFTNVYSSANWIYPNAPAGLLRLVNRARDAARDGGLLINDDFSQSLFYSFNNQNQYVDYVNRNIQVPPYFGFQLPEESKDDASLFEDSNLVSVYRFDPNSDIYFNLYNDELNLPYYKIRPENVLIKKIAQEPNIIVCYQGDAFIQTTIIKSRTWFPTEENGTNKGYKDREVIGASISHHGYSSVSTPDDNLRVTKYAHGELLEIFSENAVNTALRVKTINENTFYPLIPNTQINWVNTTFNIDNKGWGLFPFSPEPIGWETKLTTGIESYRINFGNSKTTSLKVYLADNPNIPKGDNKYPNRIRYTGQQEPNFPVLAYRMWPYNSRRDFDERYGPIVKLAIVYGRLLSVQRNSLLLHYTNQEETVPSSSGEMIIGVRSILSAQPTTLARYGSQHKFSMVVAKAGLYGWDWMNGIIWRTAPTEEGGVIAVAIEKENLIENYVKDLRIRVDGSESVPTSNIVRSLKDLTFVLDGKEGITSGYDLDSSEILFSTFWVNEKGEQQSEILRYTEDLNSFIGTSHYPAMFFFNIHRDMYSVGAKEQGSVYVHNKGMPARFYGEYYAPRFSFIVNGTQSTRDGSIVSLFHLDKHFQAMEIESPKFPFPVDKVEFETMFQKAQNNPLYNEAEFWLTPEYLMSKWAFPINIAYSGQEDFFVDSNMMGKWLKVTVTLKKGLDTFVKNIMTIFTTTNR